MARSTKNQDFSSVAEQLSVRAINEFELEELKNYQLGLVDYMVYEIGCGNQNAKQTAITAEIKRVEVYLRKKWSELLNRTVIK